MGYKTKTKKYYKKNKTKKQSTWQKMVGIGKQLYTNYKGPLGYAIKGVNLLKNLVNTEKKFSDVAVYAGITITTTGNAIPMTLTAQGSTDITRNGNSILANALEIKGVIAVNATATRNVVRVIAFIDKQNAQGTAPTLANLLSSANTRAFMNVNNTDRFVILKNEMFNVDLDGPKLAHFEWHIPLNRLHIKYDGTAADQASAAEHHIYLVAISDEGTNGPTLSVDSRLSFYDN